MVGHEKSRLERSHRLRMETEGRGSLIKNERGRQCVGLGIRTDSSRRNTWISKERGICRWFLTDLANFKLLQLCVGFAEVAPVLFDKVLDPSRERAAAFLCLEIEVTTGGTEKSTAAIDDEIPHGVHESGLLHVEPEDLVHREFEDFPNGSNGDGEAEAENGNGKRRGREAIALEKHEDTEEAKDSEGDCRSGVEDDIQPPEPFVEITNLAEKEGGVDEENNDNGEAARKLDVEAFLVAKGENGHDEGHGGGEGSVPSQGVDGPAD